MIDIYLTFVVIKALVLVCAMIGNWRKRSGRWVTLLLETPNTVVIRLS